MSSKSPARVMDDAAGTAKPARSTPGEFDHAAHLRELHRAAKEMPVNPTPRGGKRTY